jgi:hypothetical protein
LNETTIFANPFSSLIFGISKNKYIITIMKKLFSASLPTFLLLAIAFLNTLDVLHAQCNNGVRPDGTPCGGTIGIAVPFLRISPDARAGAMGDVGVATSGDANSLAYNASKMVFATEKSGISATYTPWLRNLGLDDIFLAYLGFYKQFGAAKNKQAVGASLRYFSLGQIQWTDEQGSNLNVGNPREFELAVSYARQLSPYLSIAGTGKFVSSNLATGLTVGGTEINTGTGGALDLSMTYNKPIKMGDKKANFAFGVALTNMGSKITYNKYADYMPANLGIGACYTYPLDQFNTIAVALDIHKLMVPTPRPNDSTDVNGNKVPDWREQSAVAGIISSFGDAPGGFSEELREFYYSFGLEYWYDKQFAVRAGYFYEDKEKGGRQYLTLGLGLKYNIFGVNLSYLVPTGSQRNPLDNTLRFSLLFDMASFKVEDADGN